MADALRLQMNIRQNAEELQDILQDLNKWEDEIKTKDNELLNSKIVHKQSLPPIRNQSNRKKKKKKKKEQSSASNKDNVSKGEARISSYDYRSWDKFDVEKVLKEMDEQEEMKTFSSSEEESDGADEDIENERWLQKALFEKDKGNALFKEGKYEEAIHCYTTGIQLDPTNAVLPANRAMCLLKLQRYGAAEADCTQALSLDSSYTKAYLRRGAARFQMGRVQQAEADYREALRLEPSNKQAQVELKSIKKLLEDKKREKQSEKQESENCANKTPVKSKKPLKRIVIEEIGTESESEDDSSDISTKAQATESLSTEETRSNTQQALLARPDERTKNLTLESTDVPPKTTPSSVSSTLSSSSSATPSSSQPQFLSSNSRSKSADKTFAVPKSSGQFQADWRALQKQPDKLFAYFKNIKPKLYPKLFQQSIEPDMLAKIIYLLRDFYLMNGLPVYEELKNLAEVKRFGMAIMFLSDKDRKVISDLINSVRQTKELFQLSEDDILDLAKKYGIS